MQDLSQAIFINLPEDEQALRDFHSGSSKQAIGLEELNKKPRSYWNRHVRRMVRQADELKAALDGLMDKYMGEAGLDSRGRPLLTEATSQVLAAAKELINSESFCGESAYPTVSVPKPVCTHHTASTAHYSN